MKRLCPRQREIDKIKPHIDAAFDEQKHALHQGKKLDPSKLHELQAQMSEAHNTPRLVQCFKCEDELDMDKHNWSRLAVLNIGHWDHSVGTWQWDHYNSEPLELPLCRECHDHALEHATGQEI